MPLVLLYYSNSLIIAVLLSPVVMFPTVSRTSRSRSNTSPAYYSFGIITFIRGYIPLYWDSVNVRVCWDRINFVFVWILPIPITVAMCVSQEQSFDISTPRCVYWSTIANSSSPHFQLKLTGSRGFCYMQHATTAYFLASAVALHLPVCSSGFSHYFCDPSGFKSSTKINPDTVSSPTVASCFAASTTTIRPLVYLP